MGILVNKQRKIIKIDKGTLVSIIILFLYCTNFMNYGLYIPILLSPFIIYYLFYNKFDKFFYLTIGTLLLFSILYSLILISYGDITLGTAVRYTIIPTVIYIWGYKLVEEDYQYKKTFSLIFTIIISCVAYAFLGLLSTAMMYGDNALSILGGRYALNIWDGSLIKATLITPYVIFGLALLPFIFIHDKSRKTKIAKIISIVCFALSLYSILLLGNRSGLVVIILSFISSTLFTRKMGLRKIGQFVASILIIVLFYLLFIFNAFDIKSTWETSLLYSRFQEESLSENPRIDTWLTTFYGLFENPLGGEITDIPLGYAHNMWLDVGYVAGIFPLFPLMIFTIILLISLRRFAISDNPVSIKSIIISIIVAMLAISFVEPIIEGVFTFFTLFCFIAGLIHRININNIRSKDNGI